MRFLCIYSLLVCFYNQTTSAEQLRLRWSHSRSLVTEAFELSLTTTPANESIRYTLDGSSPSESEGLRYARPIQIDRNTVVRAIATNATGESSTVKTQTFLFPNQVADQKAFPKGYPTEMISRRRGPDRPHEFDWAMDPDVLNDVANNGNLESHLLELPTISIVMDLEDFNFIYTNHRGRGVDYERAASIELIYPNKDRYSDFNGFQIDCGIRMQGGGAIDQARKKSLRLLFKKDYGKGSLDYPLFESAEHFGGNAASSFEGVILRAGGNTNWSKDDAWKHEPSTYLRDPFMRDSQIAISGIGSRSVFTHLYLNGLYFGLYNLSERPDEKFQAAYLGGEEADHYAINHGGTVAGDSTQWNNSIKAASQLNQASRYEATKKRIDINAYCDYILLNWLVGMGDWPWNNFYAGMPNTPAGKLRYYCWDSEYAFWTIEGYLRSNPRGWANQNFTKDGGTIATLWRELIKNEEFLLTFADRIYKHCYNDGPLTDQNMKARFSRLAATIENAIVAESARWGDSSWGRENDPHTRANDWIPNRDDVLALMDGNVEIFIEDLRNNELYPRLKPPTLLMGTSSPASTTLVSIENPNNTGLVYYTIDGTDPRLPGGNISPDAIKYTSPLSITEATRLKTRVITPERVASPLHERFLTAAPVGFPLRITELMYHPETSEALEFVELQNVSSATIDLTGFYFQGLDYRFRPGSILNSNEIILLIPNDDPDLFATTYPQVTVYDTYGRHLANNGETIVVLDRYDRVMTSVVYNDADTPDSAWPSLADGKGHSLEVVDVLQQSFEPEHWKLSTVIGGTPGIVLAQDSSLDSDEDGFTDIDEIIAGTDIKDPTSFLRMEIFHTDNGTIRFHFEAVTGRSYTLQSTADLFGDSWSVIAAFPEIVEPGRRTHDQPKADLHHFYQLVVGEGKLSGKHR